MKIRQLPLGHQDQQNLNRALRLTGRAARYAILPGIIPRLRSLSFALAHFLFLFTRAFGTAGLIDPMHPCLREENIGRYRFADIISLAYYGVLQDRKNLYKIAMFIAVSGAFVMFMLLAAVTIGMILFQVPMAVAQYYGDAPPETGYSPSSDFAYIFLTEVFGDTGSFTFWNGQSTQDANIIFGPILRAMFATYSQAILILAVLVIIYLIGFMVIESARTGVPFGQRFNSVWAPFRIALGIGLLLPISAGYNGAQLIVFQASNWGSALATNVWNEGLSAFGALVQDPSDPNSLINPGNPDNPARRLVAAGQPTEPYSFIRGVFLNYICRDAMNLNMFNSCMGRFTLDTSTLEEGVYKTYMLGTFKEAEVMNSDYCGSYKVPIATRFSPVPIRLTAGGTEDLGSQVSGVAGIFGINETPQIGYLPQLIAQQQVKYYEMALPLITAATAKITAEVHQHQDKRIQKMEDPDIQRLHVRLLKLYKVLMGYKDGLYFNTSVTDPPLYPSDPIDNMTMTPPGFIEAAQQDGNELLKVFYSAKRYGWASAGSLMMTLAHVNNIMSSAINTPPISFSMPRLMSNPIASPYYRNESMEDAGTTALIASWLGIAQTDIEILQQTAKTINLSNTWFIDRVDDKWPENIDGLAPPNGNAEDTIGGETGVRMSIWKQQTATRVLDNTEDADLLSASGFQGFLISFLDIAQNNMNPLAQIVAIGSAMFTWASALILLAMIFGPSGAFSAAFFFLLPIIIGAYILCVILPIMLFGNFMFAVIEWVISIFEAIVGVPLWALSMISISGESIGKSGIGGVMKLFEIMLRPTVIVVVTVGAMIGFAAAARFFTQTYLLFLQTYLDTTSNGFTGGFKNALVMVGSIFMYVMTMYAIGNSCFKLIPTIANTFARWINGPQGFSKTLRTTFDDITGLDQFQNVTGMAEGANEQWSERLNK